MKLRVGYVLVGFLSLVFSMAAQTSGSSTSSTSQLPRLVKFSGTLTGVAGSPASGVVGVTFALYSEPSGGAPLWLETQNVQPDKNGHYTVLLGSTKPEGLPVDLFVSEQAQWLGVKPEGQNEQPRVLLMSVPYAMKALDAETIGGRPASSFMLAPAVSSSSDQGVLPPGTITGSGTADFVPLFTGATTIGNSKIFQTVAGNVGIATTTPAAKLDVKGTGDVRDTLTLFPRSTHPVLSVHGTALSVDHTGTVTFVAGQTFPGTGTVTSVGSGAGLTGGPITTSGTLSVANAGVTNAMLAHSSLTVTANSPLSGGGSVSLGGGTSLGLKSCNSNQVLQFISGAWTCATVGTGTVTSVGLSAPSSDFTVSGSPVTSSGTLGLKWNVAPTSAATANAIVKRDTNGSFSAGAISASGGLTGLSAGIAVYGETSGGGGGSDGVHGVAHGSGSGVAGINDGAGSVGVWGQENEAGTETFGVLGYAISPKGAGVLGEGVGPSSIGSRFPPFYGTGVWADTNASSGAAVYATADDGIALLGFNNSVDPPLELINYGTGELFYAANNANASCVITANGDLLCSGSKSAVVPVDGGSRKVALYAVEAPENWFEDAGSGQLSNGEAVINLEAVFGQTVNTGFDYHIFLTPNGDCKGLYVAQKSATSFVVRELGGGTSSIPFDYRIMAKRKGYETIRLADKTKDFDMDRLRRATRTGTPPPSPQQMREQHRPMVTPPVAQVSK